MLARCASGLPSLYHGRPPPASWAASPVLARGQLLWSQGQDGWPPQARSSAVGSGPQITKDADRGYARRARQEERRSSRLPPCTQPSRCASLSLQLNHPPTSAIASANMRSIMPIRSVNAGAWKVRIMGVDCNALCSRTCIFSYGSWGLPDRSASPLASFFGAGTRPLVQTGGPSASRFHGGASLSSRWPFSSRHGKRRTRDAGGQLLSGWLPPSWRRCVLPGG